MSTLEKFGILVILILVVIIGVVAVWGVGGEKDNPFAQDPAGGDVAVVDPAATPVNEPGAGVPGWTDGAPPAPPAPGPVPPPAVQGSPTPPGGGAAVHPAPGPADAGFTTHTVVKGETGASIAKKYYGNANRWKDIAAANNNKDPRRLKIGEVLRIPGAGGTSVADGGLKPPAPPRNSFGPDLPPPVNPADGPTDTIRANPAPAPAPAPEAGGREVEVRSGDTLYEIARRELGDANLYYKIIKANPGLDPKRLRPGMKVKLPVL